MSEVKRYECYIEYDDSVIEEEDICGKYVYYSDYEKLETEIKRLNDKYDFQRLVKENEYLRKILQEKCKITIID